VLPRGHIAETLRFSQGRKCEARQYVRPVKSVALSGGSAAGIATRTFTGLLAHFAFMNPARCAMQGGAAFVTPSSLRTYLNQTP
jgi:hypothetical protein